DGWWAEGYRPDAGWALPLERTYSDQHLQNDLDAETIYNILETEIVPTYFDRNERGISTRWLSYVRNIMGEVAPIFTMKRMMDHYIERYYSKLQQTGKVMNANQYEAAKSLTNWKAQMRKNWDRIDLLSMEVVDTQNRPLSLGEHFQPHIQLNLNGVDVEEVGVEVLFFKRVTEQDLELRISEELKLESLNGNVATYTVDLPVNIAGVYEYGFRLFPKHENLAHRQDFHLVRWL
ncbi:MAG: DUF3417 domain-containing protein, partial [Bacteroidota bacterium]